jgi:hypothetical protein
VHTHEIHIAGGREAVSEIRRELFVFPEVLEVLATSRADALVVVFARRPRPAEWNRHLSDAGYQLIGRTAKSPQAQRLALVAGSSEQAPVPRSESAARSRARARHRRRMREASEVPRLSA